MKQSVCKLELTVSFDLYEFDNCISQIIPTDRWFASICIPLSTVSLKNVIYLKTDKKYW